MGKDLAGKVALVTGANRGIGLEVAVCLAKGTMMSNWPDMVSRSGFDRIRGALDAGVVVDARDKKGRTALFRAARLGWTSIVELLLSCGADVNLVEQSGEAPLQAAARYGHIECVKLLL